MQGGWRGRSPRYGPACLRGRDGDWGWSRGRKERVPPGEAETLLGVPRTGGGGKSPKFKHKQELWR